MSNPDDDRRNPREQGIPTKREPVMGGTFQLHHNVVHHEKLITPYRYIVELREGSFPLRAEFRRDLPEFGIDKQLDIWTLIPTVGDPKSTRHFHFVALLNGDSYDWLPWHRVMFAGKLNDGLGPFVTVMYIGQHLWRTYNAKTDPKRDIFAPWSTILEP